MRTGRHRSGGGRSRTTQILVVVAVFCVAAVVVVADARRRNGAERTVTDALPTASLPATVETTWVRRMARAMRPETATVAGNTLVYIVTERSTPFQAIEALDLRTGEAAWSRRISGSVEITMVGATDSTVVMTTRGVQDHRLAAFDVTDGDLRWEVVSDAIASARMVAGSRVVIDTAGDSVTLRDPETGVAVFDIAGDVATTDGDGNLDVTGGDGFVRSVSLADAAAAPDPETNRPVEADVIGRGTPEGAFVLDRRTFALVDGAFIESTDESDRVVAVRNRPERAADLGADSATRVVPIGDGRAVVESASGVAGVWLRRDSFDVVWTLDGAFVESFSTHEGLRAIVQSDATGGDGSISMIDPLDGTVFATLPGELGRLVPASNGILVTTVDDPIGQVAWNPDGSESWSLPSSVADLGAVVGDRVVVTFARDRSTDGSPNTGIVVTGHGEVREP